MPVKLNLQKPVVGQIWPVGHSLLWPEESYDQPRQHIRSRDITLPTKVHLVKGMVFPVVMYGCESWTIKKAEHRGIDG